MKYVWAFVIFIILIVCGVISLIGDLLEFAFGVALTGIGLIALIGLWIYVKVKN